MSVREMVAAVVAVLVTAYLVWRWRRLSFERKALGILAVLALAVYASGVLSTLPDPKAIIEDVAKKLGAWTYAVVGDTTSFYIGRRLGRQFLEKHGPRVKIPHERLEMVDGYFDRHGGKTILIGRFIGLVRALAPFIAGSSGLAYRRFIPFSVVGTGLWATAFAVLGYIFWQSFDEVANVAGRATLVFGCLVALVVGVVWSYRQLRDPAK